MLTNNSKGSQTEFYQLVQPLERDISDYSLYAQRRSALYKHLGLIPKLIKGSSLLEFGPGYGENSLYTMMQHPDEYYLVEANKQCLQKTRERLTHWKPKKTSAKYFQEDILSFEIDKKFDIVICEAIIPLQINPQQLLMKTASFCDDGGLLCITCQDSVSLFSEVLRRIVTQLMIETKADISRQVKLLLPVFTSHLATIKGMNRSHENWIIDQMLHPWTGETFSMLNAIGCLQDDFEVYGSSPKFFNDWRWYRNIVNSKSNNKIGIENYYFNLHNFIDYRYTFAPRASKKNIELLSLCDQLFSMVKKNDQEYEAGLIDEMLSIIHQISENVASFSLKTSQSIDDFLIAIEEYRKNGGFFKFGKFESFFGRGQQNLSFIKLG